MGPCLGNGFNNARTLLLLAPAQFFAEFGIPALRHWDFFYHVLLRLFWRCVPLGEGTKTQKKTAPKSSIRNRLS